LHKQKPPLSAKRFTTQFSAHTNRQIAYKANGPFIEEKHWPDVTPENWITQGRKQQVLMGSIAIPWDHCLGQNNRLRARRNQALFACARIIINPAEFNICYAA
jgi:hypothetical protein